MLPHNKTKPLFTGLDMEIFHHIICIQTEKSQTSQPMFNKSAMTNLPELRPYLTTKASFCAAMQQAGVAQASRRKIRKHNFFL